MTKSRPWLRPVLIIGLLILGVALLRLLDLSSFIPEIKSWVQSLGWAAPLVFTLIYAIGVIFALPGAFLTVTTATLFGVVDGIIIASVGSTTGATGAFLIARYGARRSISNWIQSNARFASIDAASERHGALIVFLVRFVPVIPFNLVNYGFGLTRVRLWTYVFWSWLAMLPWTIIYVVGTDASVQAAAGNAIPWPWIVLGIVLAVAVFLIGRWAKSRFKQLESKT